MDWLDLLAVQGTLKKSLFQHHSSKASILWRPAFFIVQLSHPYMTTGKTIALTIWIFVCKVISLLFNTGQTFYVCHSFPSKEQVYFIFMVAVIVHSDFGPQENKVCHCFHCFPIYLPWSEWKFALKLNIQKTKIMASGPIISWQIDGETVETLSDYFLGFQNHCRWWLQPWN